MGGEAQLVQCPDSSIADFSQLLQSQSQDGWGAEFRQPKIASTGDTGVPVKLEIMPVSLVFRAGEMVSSRNSAAQSPAISHGVV